RSSSTGTCTCTPPARSNSPASSARHPGACRAHRRSQEQPAMEGTTMPDTASDPGERAAQLAAIRDHARRAVISLARDRGAELTTRPMVRDSGLTVYDLEPLTGARAARDIELAARHAARAYIRQAPAPGHR